MNRLQFGFPASVLSWTMIVPLLLYAAPLAAQQKLSGIIYSTDSLPMEAVTITV